MTDFVKVNDAEQEKCDEIQNRKLEDINLRLRRLDTQLVNLDLKSQNIQIRRYFYLNYFLLFSVLLAILFLSNTLENQIPTKECETKTSNNLLRLLKKR